MESTGEGSREERREMENVMIRYMEKPSLKDTIFIEGLPGIGNVGKLAAEHLIDELGARKFAEIVSKYFPPQVMVLDGGLVKLVNNELYYVKNVGKDLDIIFLVGDYQGLNPEGQYELTDFILHVLREFNVKRIFTLGGYGVGKIVDKPRVFGAATHEELVKEMEKFGVVFSRGEPGTGIVGASGLLLGLGLLYDMHSVCFMGETSGYFVDPKSARAVLEVLTQALGIEVDFSELEAKAKQIDAITTRLREAEVKPEEPRKDLGYIG
ncbi:MAG: proteasome assembly chaperone family protein [Thermoplasmata archaeon]